MRNAVPFGAEASRRRGTRKSLKAAGKLRDDDEDEDDDEERGGDDRGAALVV